MARQRPEFKIGAYRPIYLWGGPGTIRMNRLKFMNQPVDEAAHHEAHRTPGAKRVLEDLYCNWVHLMYNWGFPPEVEVEDWDDFERAAAVYHQLGSKVFAYIQTSNCVYDGSFKSKDWYARDHRGKKVFYYSGRYMVCLNNPEWKGHLRDIVRGAIERGADGIFFDNLWHGEMPVSLFGAWLGAAGCHCGGCQRAYFEAGGERIPRTIEPESRNFRRYLRWRANQVTRLVTELTAYARELQPGTPVSANDYDIGMRATYLVYGQDPTALAHIDGKRVTMVENFALPKWDEEPSPRLANNALTIRNVRALIRGAQVRNGEESGVHLSVLSYDVGIGFDPLYTPRRYQQGICEAAACGASMTIKGTEYFHDGQHTTITPNAFGTIRTAIGKYNRWLKENSSLYTNRKNAAPVGLLYPGEELWVNWQRLAPLFLGAGQTLLRAGIPWRVVNPGDSLDGLCVLLVFNADELEQVTVPQGCHTISVTDLAGWALPPQTLVARNAALRAVVGAFGHFLMNAYFGNKFARNLFDSVGLPKLITQSSLFRMPSKSKQDCLLAALPEKIYPRVHSQAPVLIETWKLGDILQIHLVNYGNSAQQVQVEFDREVLLTDLSPEGSDGNSYQGQRIDLQIDLYRILIVEKNEIMDM